MIFTGSKINVTSYKEKTYENFQKSKKTYPPESSFVKRSDLSSFSLDINFKSLFLTAKWKWVLLKISKLDGCPTNSRNGL